MSRHRRRLTRLWGLLGALWLMGAASLNLATSPPPPGSRLPVVRLGPGRLSSGVRLPVQTTPLPRFTNLAFSSEQVGVAPTEADGLMQFPFGTRTLSVSFTYDWLPVNQPWRAEWLHNGAPLTAGEFVGDGSLWSSATVSLGDANDDALEAGDYALRLTFNGGAVAELPFRVAPPSRYTGRWIEVDLTQQVLEAKDGDVVLLRTLVSSGAWGLETPVGEYRIYTKLWAQDMRGPGYFVPGVPRVNYFYADYAIHGVTWHDGFGSPRSHGCVGVPYYDGTSDWLYRWASIGTPVSVHY